MPSGLRRCNDRAALRSADADHARRDKAYDAEDFELRSMNATPHVAQNTNGRSSAIDGRTTRHAGYAGANAPHADGGSLPYSPAKAKQVRGRERVGWAFTFAAAAYNLARLPKLLEASARRPRPTVA